MGKWVLVFLPRGLDHSQSKLYCEVQKEKKKISNTTNKNDNTLETTKKKRNKIAKTELGRTSIKNQQNIRSSSLFNGRLVWHLIHTLLKV